MTRSPAPRKSPKPADIALAYDALVEALWRIHDQSEAGGPNFTDQIARALGELAGRPDDSQPSGAPSVPDGAPAASTVGTPRPSAPGGVGRRT